MLTGIYLLIPFIQKICADNKLIKYFILLWLICNIIIPMFPVQTFTVQFQMHFVMGYIGYFILGYYLSQCYIDKKHRIILYITGIAATGYTILATVIDSRNKGIFVKTHFDSFSWNVVLMAISIFVLFLYKKEKYNSWQAVFTYLAKISLVVYMLHPFFEEKIDRIDFNPCLVVPLVSIVIYCICVVIALALKTIKKVTERKKI